MAASNSDNRPSVTSLDEMDEKCEPPNYSTDNSQCVSQAKVNAEQSETEKKQPPSSKRCSKCANYKQVAIISAILCNIIAIVAVFVIFAVLGWHIIIANGRLDRLESQCNNLCISVATDASEISTDLRDGDLLRNLSEQFSRLDDEIRDIVSGIRQTIDVVKETHQNDTSQIQRNMSTLLLQLNHTFSDFLLSYSNEIVSNMTHMMKYIENEMQSIRNDSLMIVEDVSLLFDQVTDLESRFHELEVNASEFEKAFTDKLEVVTKDFREQVAGVEMNISSNEQLLKELSSTQVEHKITLMEVNANVSQLEDRINERLTEVWINFTHRFTTFDVDLSKVDESHRNHLENLTSVQNSLLNELSFTKEQLISNASALSSHLSQLDMNLANNDEHLQNLTSVQVEILYNLGILKEDFLGNVSAFEQSLTHLSEDLTETIGNVQSVSSLHSTLRLDFNLTKEVLLANLSSLEQRLTGDIDLTQSSLQNVSLLQADLQSDFVATKQQFIVNVSALSTSLEVVTEDLGVTKTQLRNLSSRQSNLQADHVSSQASVQQSLSQLDELIHHMKQNHSSFLIQHSRALSVLEANTSWLTFKIHNASRFITSQSQKISTVESSMTRLDSRLTTFNDDLSAKIDKKAQHLGTRIDDHIDWIQISFDRQSNRLDGFETRIRGIDSRLNGGSRSLPFGMLSLIIISSFTYFVLE